MSIGMCIRWISRDCIKNGAVRVYICGFDCFGEMVLCVARCNNTRQIR